MLPVEQNVYLSATGKAHHLTLWVMNSLTCMRASWSSKLALRLTIDELTCPMPQGRNLLQIMREPSWLSENKRLNKKNKRNTNMGASLSGFYLPLQIPRLARDTMNYHTCLTLARASQPNNLPFPPCSRKVSPIQAASFHLQSGDSECLPATKLYLFVFTCPTQRVLISRRTPARALLARQSFLFKPPARQGLPVRHGDY